MNNSIADLNNYLFEQLEDLANAESDEELDQAVKRAKAVTGVADKILHAGELVVKAETLKKEYGGDVDLSFIESSESRESKKKRRKIS